MTINVFRKRYWYIFLVTTRKHSWKIEVIMVIERYSTTIVDIHWYSMNFTAIFEQTIFPNQVHNELFCYFYLYPCIISNYTEWHLISININFNNDYNKFTFLCVQWATWYLWFVLTKITQFMIYLSIYLKLLSSYLW